MKKKIAVVVSVGGHLTEAQKILPDGIFEKNEIIIFTEKRPRSEKLKEKTYFIKHLAINPWNYLTELIKFLQIFKKEKIDFIFTTGAHIALPALLVGKFLGIKSIFVETITHPKTTTMVGRVAYYISDIFLVQNKGMEKFYGKKAKYEGGII